jgi:hypothetical protein
MSDRGTPETRREGRLAIKKRNHAHIAAIREHLVCAHCGAKAVDFHRTEYHTTLPHRRISQMSSHTLSLAAIDDEIIRATPLCRACHAKVDGRVGEGNGRAKLTDKDIPIIRDLLKSGVPMREIAARFGVSFYPIWSIARGKTWTHIPEEN